MSPHKRVVVIVVFGLMCLHFVCSPLSESANAVGSGLAVPASQSGISPMCDVIKHAVSTFRVNDWSLFGSSA